MSYLYIPYLVIGYRGNLGNSIKYESIQLMYLNTRKLDSLRVHILIEVY